MKCPTCGAIDRDDARFCGACGTAAPSEPSPGPRADQAPRINQASEMIGRVIAGRYRVLAKLGEGGMGAVFRAEQISLKRLVAVKLLRPDLSVDPLLLRRFNAEAEAVAKLSHPGTVNIYDFGQDTDGTLFIAMELLDGSSLRSVIQREAPLPVARALAIASQIAASLADAHAHAIVHRDLKPDNVMLQDRGRERDVVRVVDFGIAKLRDDSRASRQAMTQTGDVLGTPQYMAPEQIRAQTIDGRTDIYALGCVLYEMVTARPPHDAPTVLAMLSKHLIEKPVPPSQRRPELALPAAIDALILGAMAKDPRARPPTMEAFGGQISALVQGLPAAPWRDDTPALDGASSRGLVRVDTAVAFSMLSPRPSPPDTAVRSRTTTHAPGLPDPWPATSPPVMPPPHAPATQRPIGRKAAVIAIAGVIAAAGTAALIIAGQRRSPVPTPPVTARAAAGSEVPPHAAPVERIEPSTDASTAPAPTPATPSWMPTPQPPSPPVRKKVVPPPGPRPRPASRAETPAPAPPPPTPVPAPPPPTPAPASAPVPPVPTPAPASPLPMPGPATFDGQKLALGRGVQLILPPGFTYTVSKDITVINKPGTAVILTVPIPPGNDDPLQLTRVATGNSDMTFVAMSAITVGGVRRPMTTYNAKYNGVTVQIAIVPFIGRRYRLAVIFVVRLALSSDPDILRLRDELYTRRILLP